MGYYNRRPTPHDYDLPGDAASHWHARLSVTSPPPRRPSRSGSKSEAAVQITRRLHAPLDVLDVHVELAHRAVNPLQAPEVAAQDLRDLAHQVPMSSALPALTLAPAARAHSRRRSSA